VTGRLAGKRAIITGGANGLGAATARLFASEGATIVLADLARAEGAAASVITEIESAGGIAHFVPVDVRDAAATRATIDAAADLMGGVDTVVASAGVGAPPQPSGSIRQLADLDIDGFDLVMDINLRGVFVTCQRAAQLMIEAGHGGAMVTLASMASKRPSAGVYSISKAAVWMMTRCLAQKLGKYELFQSMVYSSAGDDVVAQEAFREARRSQVALGRFGTPDDVARTALFLCSDESSYFTGSILHPDGGYTSTFGGG
jgi:NAD(P)-dependent dehydrogenase (short-subunit alcohol dehydrogenase family)